MDFIRESMDFIRYQWFYLHPLDEEFDPDVVGWVIQTSTIASYTSSSTSSSNLIQFNWKLLCGSYSSKQVLYLDSVAKYFFIGPPKEDLHQAQTMLTRLIVGKWAVLYIKLLSFIKVCSILKRIAY